MNLNCMIESNHVQKKISSTILHQGEICGQEKYSVYCISPAGSLLVFVYNAEIFKK